MASTNADAEMVQSGPSEQEQPKRDAFSELMSPKKKKKQASPSTAKVSSRDHTAPSSNSSKAAEILSTAEQRNLNSRFGRGALAAYTTSPTSFPPSRVISHNEHFVVINDLYPKSSVHLLLLPRDPTKQLQHPFDALDGSDPDFLAAVKQETAKLRALAASELRRRFGRSSAQDAARNAVLDAPGDADGDATEATETKQLSPGRDWTAEIMSGVHASPSMNHLHVHVLSVDRVSDSMHHRKHYNSFATPFLVPIEDFPLAADDPRRRPGREGYLERELTCWRCGKGFGMAFAKLKAHLNEEFEAWKRE